MCWSQGAWDTTAYVKAPLYSGLVWTKTFAFEIKECLVLKGMFHWLSVFGIKLVTLNFLELLAFKKLWIYV